MIFIFDWGYKTYTQYGYLTNSELPWIKSDFVQLLRVRFWFRAFFIPLIPTKTIFAAGDQKSQEFVQITQEDFYKLLPFAELNARVIREEISEEEYNKLHAELMQKL